MKSSYKKILFFVGVIIVGFINGFFGGGGGIVCVPILKHILNCEDKQAHATTVFVMVLQSIPTLIVYITGISIKFFVSAFVVLGALIGGFIGSLMLNKIKNETLNILFILVVLFSGIFVVLR